MRANEFVKKFGWGKTIELIEFYNRCGSFTCDCDFTYDDLKRLVESYELVEYYKNTYGVDARWFFIANYCQEHRLAPRQSDVYDFVATKYDSYVADVESCQ